MRNNSSSLRRALTLLETIAATAGRRQGANLAELAEGIESTKSTVLRLLAPLIEAQLVRQDGDGTYRMGIGVLGLAGACLVDLDVRSAAQPVLREIAEATGHAAHLLVYNEGRVTYVDKVTGGSPIQMASRVGDTGTAYSTASGKAMLAFLGDDEVQRVIDLGMPAKTAASITDGRQLREHLAVVRDRGVAYDDVENEEGIRCIAAPVFNHTGAVVCAVSVSGPAEAIAAQRDSYTSLVTDGAKRISLELGHRGGEQKP
ncbi:IclR family transcriptional regulator [Mycolicibacterium sp. P9-64]|uniref:IclR family transcriptional regulator n=1 Tax=Mycolicibacterium sp. P9-64 TaxID=2024612 RepID=UPI0011EBE9D6|nr:IclR family transcriptional regulator [Mycolicibacterium sp. P9-64]KAA0079843.1 IclR family transcriptional regulator [Mycolicibacterium sp. P9-64]